MNLEELQAAMRKVDEQNLERDNIFSAIQSSPCPLNRVELQKLIDKRPEVWGKFKAYLAKLAGD